MLSILIHLHNVVGNNGLGVVLCNTFAVTVFAAAVMELHYVFDCTDTLVYL